MHEGPKQTNTWLAHAGSTLELSDALGRPVRNAILSSRTGENPPYGMIGGIEETSASYEARSAPRSYPTMTCLPCTPMQRPYGRHCAARRATVVFHFRILSCPQHAPGPAFRLRLCGACSFRTSSVSVVWVHVVFIDRARRAQNRRGSSDVR